MARPRCIDNRLRLIAVAASALGTTGGAIVSRRRSRRRREAAAAISEPYDSTVLDRSGAVRSVQSADLILAEADLEAIWTPMHLERLARTYWRFLSRATLGAIHVQYTRSERFVVFISRPAVLLRFRAPEYQMDGRRGIVRWDIESGVLVSRRGDDAGGYLQIDVQRGQRDAEGHAVAHVEVEVANFYPALASRLGTPLYKATQSRLHVLITQRFLRSLARLDLAESRVKRFARTSAASASVDDVPDPPPPDEPAARAHPARQGAESAAAAQAGYDVSPKSVSQSSTAARTRPPR